MTMIIVLDGPDGTGKTTLAHEICKQTGAKYLHLTYRWKDKIFDYHTAAIRWAARQTCPVVIDRWWPSEAIYAKAFRGGSTWPLQGRMCERVAKKFGVVYVFCLPDDIQSAVANHAELKQHREEMYDDIAAVVDLYLKLWRGESTHQDKGQYIDQLIRTGGINDHKDKILYTISDWGHAMDLFIERVATMAGLWRSLQFQPALHFDNWNITGHITEARYLLVSDSNQHKNLWPHYQYDEAVELTAKLHELNLPESLFMWTTVDDDHFTDLMTAKNFDRVLHTKDLLNPEADLVETFKHVIR